MPPTKQSMQVLVVEMNSILMTLQLPISKSCFNCQKMLVPPKPKETNNKNIIEHNQYPNLKYNDSSASSITMQIPPTTTNRASNESSGIRLPYNPEPPQQIKPEMVNNQS